MTFTRRDVLVNTAQACLLAGCAPLASALVGYDLPTKPGAVRCLNVVNFIRGVEPRGPVDLLLPVQKQMEVIVANHLPATWLLQFDALVDGPYVDFLKKSMPHDHEVGFWFEMNQKHCVAAGVEWRGRPGYEWDSHPPVAFTIGYTEEERIKLVDAAMSEFHSKWVRYPSSVASWNLDSISMAHLSEKYGVDAFAVCRDQIATDGFTIWGAPIAGYYASKLNCWSPALSRNNQINTPVFRMLGQDPVYYYQRQFPLPDGSSVGQPDTMEPVWVSGRSKTFVKGFLAMIADAPCLEFAYAQLGQENNFGWPDMAEAYPMQMKALAQLRDAGTAHVETLGETGRRFKHAFKSTPVQAQVQLSDPFDNTNPAEKSIWYQSRYFRANLHIKGDLPYLRDLTVYSDRLPQPFLTKATRELDVEQRMPSVLDGYHWSTHPGSPKDRGAGGYFSVDGEPIRLAGEPRVFEEGKVLIAELPTLSGLVLRLRFDEKEISITLKGSGPLILNFEWDPKKAALSEVLPDRARYVANGFRYHVLVREGQSAATTNGWEVKQGKTMIWLAMAQPS